MHFFSYVICLIDSSIYINFFLVHSIDKDRFLSLNEDDISKIIPEEFEKEISNQFKQKFKLHLVRNFFVNKNKNVGESSRDVISDENAYDLPDCSNSNLVPFESITENEDNSSQSDSVAPLIETENVLPDLENASIDIPAYDNNIKMLNNIEEFYTPSKLTLNFKIHLNLEESEEPSDLF